MLTTPQRRALQSLKAWGGDLSPDVEDLVGCYGAAFWQVIDSLERKGYIAPAKNLFPITEKGLQALKEPGQWANH